MRWFDTFTKTCWDTLYCITTFKKWLKEKNGIFFILLQWIPTGSSHEFWIVEWNCRNCTLVMFICFRSSFWHKTIILPSQKRAVAQWGLHFRFDYTFFPLAVRKATNSFRLKISYSLLMLMLWPLPAFFNVRNYDKMPETTNFLNEFSVQSDKTDNPTKILSKRWRKIRQ